MHVSEALKDVKALEEWVSRGGNLPRRFTEAFAGKPGGIPRDLSGRRGGKFSTVFASLGLLFLLGLGAGAWLVSLVSGGHWQLFWWSLPVLLFGLPPLSFLGILKFSRLRRHSSEQRRSRFLDKLGKATPYLRSARHLLEALGSLETSRDQVRSNLKDLDDRLARLEGRRDGPLGEQARDVIDAYRTAALKAAEERRSHLATVEAHLGEIGQRLADQWSLALTAFEHGALVEGRSEEMAETLAQAEEAVSLAAGLTKVSRDLVHNDLGLELMDEAAIPPAPPAGREGTKAVE